MPKPLLLPTIFELYTLFELGRKLRHVRKSKGISLEVLSIQTGIAVKNLRDIERGNADMSMGMYLRVLSALDFAERVADIVSTPQLEAANPHFFNDLQSLALHKAAVKAIKEDDHLALVAAEIAQLWIRNTPDSRSMPLWSAWVDMIEKRHFADAIAWTDKGQQLRQASPLPHVLEEAVKRHILDETSELRERVVAKAQEGGE